MGMPLPVPELQPAQQPTGGSGSGPILSAPSSGSMRKRSPGCVFPIECGSHTHGGQGCKERHHGRDWAAQGCPMPQITRSLFPGAFGVHLLFPKRPDANPGRDRLTAVAETLPPLFPLLPRLIPCGHVSSLPPPCKALCPSTSSFPGSFLFTSFIFQPVSPTLGKNSPQREKFCGHSAFYKCMCMVSRCSLYKCLLSSARARAPQGQKPVLYTLYLRAGPTSQALVSPTTKSWPTLLPLALSTP